MEQSRAPTVAIAVAGFALALSLIAVIVVVVRGAKTPDDAVLAVESDVAAEHVVKLKRDAVEAVTEGGKIVGVKVTDEQLRESLKLEATDVITAIAGRELKREYDVWDALLSAAVLDPAVLYVDIQRDGKPLLLKWKLDGDLKTARKIDSNSRPPRDTAPPRSIDDTLANPFAFGGGADPRDPLLDTIKRIDDFHYEIPRSTVDRVIANPMDFAKGTRAVPAMRNGSPDGIRLYAIRPTSIYSALGIMNGDTIRTINGFALDGADKALEIYMRLKDATSLELEIMRRGRPLTIRIDIK